MKRVKIKGREQFYLLKNEQVPATLNDGHKEWAVDQPDPFMAGYLQQHNDLRIIIARTRLDPHYSARIYYVWWYRGRDLDQLDKKAMTDQDIAGYFAKTAILTYGERMCRWGCQKRWRVLYIDPISPWWADRDDFYTKKVLKDVSELNCPHCGNRLGSVIVIRILGEMLR